ncbi:MAG: NAD-dependent epimerase/dehydratase family protein [Chloroflexi bacterium]|nr:NAD-dependent epimerase/dehydratase family protein [Chloroflexota bacterium]
MTSLKRSTAVTGAFSYSGSYIAQALLAAGWQVRTLTRHPQRPHPLQGSFPAFPLDFENHDELVRNLRGVDCLVNTYWVRFNYKASSFRGAIQNTSRLLQAAKEAGVRRFVHLSVSNPDIESSLPYYRGKAEVEALIRVSGLSYAIFQPTLIFGPQELLVNNIAWLLRHAPLFPIPGDGSYRLQPIYVLDLARAVARAAGDTRNETLPAGGPETLTFDELVSFLAELLGSRARRLHLPPSLALALSKMIGLLLNDVLLTLDELDGLMQDRLYVGEPALGKTAFRDWARENAQHLGRRYTNELRRHH